MARGPSQSGRRDTPQSRRRKPVNLPRIDASGIALQHVLEGHRAGGIRVGSSKTLFPAGWSDAEISNAILVAYAHCKRIDRQGATIKVRGFFGTLEIEMWVNISTKRIETAYPVRK